MSAPPSTFTVPALLSVPEIGAPSRLTDSVPPAPRLTVRATMAELASVSEVVPPVMSSVPMPGVWLSVTVSTPPRRFRSALSVAAWLAPESSFCRLLFRLRSSLLLALVIAALMTMRLLAFSVSAESMAPVLAMADDTVMSPGSLPSGPVVMVTSVPLSSCVLMTFAPIFAPAEVDTITPTLPSVPVLPSPATISMLPGSMCHSPPRPTTGALTTSSERRPEVST